MNINATILGQAIAFIFFVWFCMKYVCPPLINAIEKRQKVISDGLIFAERAKKDLELAQANYIDYLKKANEKAQIIIEEANNRRSQILDTAKIEAQKEYINIVSKSREEIESERKRVYEELRNQIVILSIAGAEKIIERSIDESTNSVIIDKFISKL